MGSQTVNAGPGTGQDWHWLQPQVAKNPGNSVTGSDNGVLMPDPIHEPAPASPWLHLREGMTMEQVAALLGQPLRNELDHGLTFWGYSADPSRWTPRAVFDSRGLLDSWMITTATPSARPPPRPSVF